MSLSILSFSSRPKRLLRSGVMAMLAMVLAAFFNGSSPPAANADVVTVAEDSGDTLINVLANDTAADSGAVLTVTAVTQPAPSGTVKLTNGQVRFAPAPDFNGSVTFTYTISDGTGGTATASVEVTVSAVNDPPTAEPDTFSVDMGSELNTLDVLANDSSSPDPGETLTISQVTQPAADGTVSIAPGGTALVFTPAPDFLGLVRFKYTVSDGNGGSTSVPVTVDVVQVDSDGDGLYDDFETRMGLDPRDSDSDDDGVLDKMDGLVDTDEDGMIDALDPDSDNDGLLDGTERGVTAATADPGTQQSSPHFVPDAGPETTTDPYNADTDGDGLLDGGEDADHNGAVGSGETDPTLADTDGGGLNDGEEVNAGGNPLDLADDQKVRGRGCASTGTGTLPPMLLLLAVPLWRRRQPRRGTGKAWGLLAAVLAAAPASAQSQAETSQAIDVQQYKPGPGWKDMLGLHSPRLARHLGWNLGLSFNYAKDPLNFLQPQTGQFSYAIVKNQFTLDLLGSIALYDRFEIGVALPITSQGSASAGSSSPLFPERLDATGVGDLRLVLKEHLFSSEGGLHVGLAVPLLLPTSGGKEFLGRGGVAAFPRLMGEWVSEGGLRVLANVGVNLQPRKRFYNLNVGNEFAYGVGAEVPFQSDGHRLAAEATLMGAIGMQEKDLEERPLEVLAALRYHLSDGLAAHLGGGWGLTGGYGTPGFRVVAGFAWTAEERTLPTRLEPPPYLPPPAGEFTPIPENVDGFQDERRAGPDDDGDRFEDERRAELDSDGDGFPDGGDRCPDRPETMNGFEDGDGCPDVPPLPSLPPKLDSDGDGLENGKDRCPQFPEDRDGFQDEDGCPDSDNDEDGVIDAVDRCPAEPETLNGVNDRDGCPDTAGPAPRKNLPR
jgi:hypothetical protein